MSSADSSRSPAALSATAVTPSAHDRLEVGGCWQGRYRIEREQRAAGRPSTFFACRTADETSVVIRAVTPASDSPQRREAARRLSEMHVPSALELLETVAQPEGRAEVWRAPQGPSLAEWLDQRDLDPAHVLPIARALARALLALHERGLALLQLSTATVHFDREQLDQVVIAGLDHAVALGLEGVVAVPTDPTLIPPEGLGVTHLPANDDLKAWDWWTLGRLVQELVLGKSIMVHLLQREVPRDSGEVRQEAEVLLNEAQVHELRPGAVEAMPEMAAEVRALLRGVLTAPRVVRWTDAQVSAWLDGQTPADRYDLPRGSVLLTLGEERLTLPEIAYRFGEDTHWTEGVAQFSAIEPPAGSAVEALLGSGAAFATEREWYTKVGEIREAASLRGYVPAARNEVLAAIAWIGVAPAGTRLRWRGRPIDLDLLRELAKDGPGLDRMRVLCSRTVIDLIQQRDSATARALRTWGFDWDEAFTLAEKHRWAPSAALRCRLAACVFATAETKAAALKDGRERFHLSTLAPLQALFGAERLSSGQLGLVAFTLERPAAFGYVTHGDWWQSEQARLRRRGEALLTSMRALRAAAAVRVGLPVFCRAANWWTLLGLLLISAAVFWPGLAGAATGVAVVAGLWIARQQSTALMKRLAPAGEGERWRWVGVADRLLVTAARESGVSGRLRLAALRHELAQVNAELIKLPITPAPAAVAGRTAPGGLWVAAIGSWTGVIALLVAVAWQAVAAGWRPASVLAGWTQDVERVAQFFSDVETPPLPAEPSDRKPAWPYVSSGVVHPLEVVERTAATDRQRIVMKSFLLSLQEHYEPSTLHGMIAAPVPVEDPAATALMLIDVATGQLATATVYRVAQPPVRQMSVEIDGIAALYLDGP